jgi:hypothetical protein
MDASESEFREGHESSGTDSNRETTSGTSRRSLLTLIAALATLPAATSQPSSATSVDVSEDRLGATRADVEPGAPMFGSVILGERSDEETEISVDGYRYDDEEVGTVEIKIHLSGAEVVVGCEAERAHGLADELRTAAEHVEGSR